MRYATLTYTTAADGSATVYGDAIYSEVCAVDYLPGTTDTGATITLTSEGLVSTTLLVKATAGTSNTRFYPRALVHKAEDGAALTGTAGGDREEPLAFGTLKLVVASGGNTKSGSVVVHYNC